MNRERNTHVHIIRFVLIGHVPATDVIMACRNVAGRRVSAISKLTEISG